MGQIASSLALGNGFSWPEWSAFPQGPTAWMPPVYPMMMAAAFKIFGLYSQQAAIFLELFQIILSTLACVLLYLVGKRLYNAQAGLCAAFLFAIYPPAIHYAIRVIWGSSLLICCMLGSILLLLRQAKHPHMKGGLCLGVLLGFTALVDPTIVSTYPGAFTWLYFKSEENRTITAKTIAATLIAFCLVISPWLVRNYLTLGRFVFIKSNLGTALFMGNNAYATGGYDDDSNYFRNRATGVVLTEAELEDFKRFDEAAQDKFFLQKAMTFIVEHPFNFVQRTVKRFIIYWTYMRPPESWQQKISLLAYLTVLTLAVAGFSLSWPIGQGVQLIGIFLLFLPAIYYFTIVGVFRYRFPSEALLIVFAGYTLDRALVSFKRRGLRSGFHGIP